jgi:uncharacterized Zn finger protein
MDLQCDKCGYILLEDCEIVKEVNSRCITAGFHCNNCGEIWLDKERVSVEVQEEILKSYGRE